MVHLLLVDDESDFRKLITGYLQDKIGPIQLTEAGSGNEAIALLKNGLRPHLTISDFHMANGNGKELFDFLIQNKMGTLFLLLTGEPTVPGFVGWNYVGTLSKAEIQRLPSVIVQVLTSFPNGPRIS